MRACPGVCVCVQDIQPSELETQTRATKTITDVDVVPGTHAPAGPKAIVRQSNVSANPKQLACDEKLSLQRLDTPAPFVRCANLRPLPRQAEDCEDLPFRRLDTGISQEHNPHMQLL